MVHARGWRNRAEDTGRGAGGAGQVEKEKGGAGDQEGFGCLYRGGREFLACASREEFGSDSRWETRDWACADRTVEKKKEKQAGLLIWAEKVFPIFLFTKKKFCKFDLNLNSMIPNSNQTTSNKTMQSYMNANKQTHLDLENSQFIIYFY